MFCLLYTSIAKDAELNVVEFEGKEVESVGLIKMDFLGPVSYTHLDVYKRQRHV